jgi:hypothetical protein
MGRKPDGAQALTGAERQARYRSCHGLAAAGGQPGQARPRVVSRARRWDETVGALVTLQAEYAAWLAALPEATREGSTGEALQVIADLDLDEIIAIRPPLGFGRD